MAIVRGGSGVAVGVGDGVAVDVGDGVAVGDGVGVTISVDVGDEVGVGVGSVKQAETSNSRVDPSPTSSNFFRMSVVLPTKAMSALASKFRGNSIGL